MIQQDFRGHSVIIEVCMFLVRCLTRSQWDLRGLSRMGFQNQILDVCRMQQDFRLPSRIIEVLGDLMRSWRFNLILAGFQRSQQAFSRIEQGLSRIQQDLRGLSTGFSRVLEVLVGFSGIINVCMILEASQMSYQDFIGPRIQQDLSCLSRIYILAVLAGFSMIIKFQPCQWDFGGLTRIFSGLMKIQQDPSSLSRIQKDSCRITEVVLAGFQRF